MQYLNFKYLGGITIAINYWFILIDSTKLATIRMNNENVH